VYAVTYSYLDLALSALYVVVLILWIMLVFHIMADIFRSHDLGGPAKAFWVLFILILPYLGALVYLVARGGSMHERQIRAMVAQQKALEDYIRRVANTKE